MTAKTATAKAVNAKASPKKAKNERKASPPKLRVVDASALRRSARRRMAFMFSFLMLAATLFGVAILYGQLVKGQQHLDDLRSEIAEAEAEQHRLERDVAINSTPESIVARALEMGMVRAVDPQFLIAVRDLDAAAAQGAGE